MTLKPKPLPNGGSYCYQCVAEVLAERKGVANQGIALWPTTMPILVGGNVQGYGVVALWACFQHLTSANQPPAPEDPEPGNQAGILRPPRRTGADLAIGRRGSIPKLEGGVAQ